MNQRPIGLAPVCVAALLLMISAACGKSQAGPTTPSASSGIRDDAGLFRLISQTDPLTGYTTLPRVEEFTSGRLNGSEAHRPIVRVRLNATAAGALQNGRLPSGGQFPNGSIVFKEIRPSTTSAPTVYVVMVKDSGSSLAGNGWLWAEFSPSGSVVYSVANRGGACTSCHLRELGPQNDLVRSFERQQ